MNMCDNQNPQARSSAIIFGFVFTLAKVRKVINTISSLVIYKSVRDFQNPQAL